MEEFDLTKEQEILVEKAIDMIQTGIAFYNKEIDSFDIDMESDLRSLLHDNEEYLYRVFFVVKRFFEEEEQIIFDLEEKEKITFNNYPTFYHVYMFFTMNLIGQYKEYEQLLEIIEKQGE